MTTPRQKLWEIKLEVLQRLGKMIDDAFAKGYAEGFKAVQDKVNETLDESALEPAPACQGPPTKRDSA